ncbi:MAG: hypothetical protein ACI97A_002760, partial [Planctomycetota bacterium]
MNKPSFLRSFLWVFLLFNSTMYAQSALSGNPQGSVHGTIRAVSVGRHHSVVLRAASLDLVVRRNNEDVVLSSAATDNSGNFRLVSGAFPEQPYLDVNAVGFAPNRFPLKKLLHGEGLLLPDLFLDRGVVVTAKVNAEKAAEAPVWLLAFPLTEAQRVIDLDGKPLLKAKFDSEGELALPHVAPGLYGFVVTDHFARFRPQVQIWRVGRDNVVLPKFQLRAGTDLSLTMKAKAKSSVDGQLIAGFGRWHPDGGAEYRFRKRVSFVASKEGVASIKLNHLPPAVCEVWLQSNDQATKGRFLPDATQKTLTWLPAAVVSGQISVPLPSAPWDKSTILVGGRAAKLGKRGQFECAGLPAGSHSVFVHIPGFPAITNRRVVLKSGEERRNFHLTPDIGSRLTGETRNPDLKRVPHVWVGCDQDETDPRFLGRYFQGVSESDGNYSIDGLAPGKFNVYLRPPTDAISHEQEVDLEKGVSASVNLRFAKGGSGGGTLLSAEKKPVPFARVQLIERPVPLSYVIGNQRQPRITAPILYQAITDLNGEYQFHGIRPGRHALVFEARGEASEIAHDINITAGVNRSGFDWQLQPTDSLLLKLPFDIPFRLRSVDHDLIERWMIRPFGSAECRVSALPPGSYKLEPLPLHLAGSTFAKDAPNYIEWRPGSLASTVTVPNTTGFAARVMPDLFLATRTIRLTIGEEFPPDTERVELTAFPLASAHPLDPIRLEYPANLSEFEITLPRGLWFLRASSPSRGAGSTGPFSLGRGFEEENPKPMSLDVAARGIAIGFVDLVRQESEQDDGVLVTAIEDHGELIRPWKLTTPKVPLSETGDLRFEDLPSGSSVIRIFGPQALIEVPVDCESFELTDLRRLVPGLPAALNLNFSTTAFLDNTLTSVDEKKPLQRRTSLLPGSFVFDFHMPWGDVESSGVWSLRQPLELEGGDVLLGNEDLSPRGRVSLKGSLRVDSLNLPFCAIELIPVLGDAYDTSRAILRGRTTRLGAFQFTKIIPGEYAFVFTFSDERGRPYQIALPLVLPDRNTTLTEIVRIRTRAMTVLTFDLGDGAPGEGALVRVLRTDLRGLGTSTVFRGKIEEIARGVADDNGEVTFRSMPLGTYDIEISRRGRVTEILPGVDLGIGSGALALQAAVSTGFGARIQILDQEKIPVEGAECFLFDKKGFRVLSDVLLQTNAKGMLFLNDLAPQALSLFAKAPGFPSQQLDDVEIKARDRRI